MRPSYLLHPSMKPNVQKPAERAQPTNPAAPIERQDSKTAKETELPGVKKFPRPLISQEESKLKFSHAAKSNFEEPPSIFYNYVVKDEGNATCRHARPSIYSVPESTSAHAKSKIAFSVVSLKGVHAAGRADR